MPLSLIKRAVTVRSAAVRTADVTPSASDCCRRKRRANDV